MSLFEQYLRKRNNVSESSIKLDVDGIFSNTTKSEFSFDPDVLIEKARTGDKLDDGTVKIICQKAKDIFAKEDNVVNLPSPITLVGDVHGQFYDVMEMFKVGGDIPNVNYLFLGDYVDRGHHSVETMNLLLLYKIRYPNRICLLRGNHETRAITAIYGF